MKEKIFDVDMIYIQNIKSNDYQVECISRRTKSTVLKFSGIEGIELNATKPAEIKNSYLQIGENDQSTWNIRFTFPVNLSISAMQNIIIEII